MRRGCARGLEFPEIEYATKVRSKYLRALEDEEFDLLPAQTYVKGFLRTYAEYLGLDGQLYVDEYNSRYVGLEEESPLRASVRQPKGRSAGSRAVLSGGHRRNRRAHGPRHSGLQVHGRLGHAGPANVRADEEAHSDAPPQGAQSLCADPVDARLRVDVRGARRLARRPALWAGTLEPGKIQNFRNRKIWLRIDARRTSS